MLPICTSCNVFRLAAFDPKRNLKHQLDLSLTGAASGSSPGHGLSIATSLRHPARTIACMMSAPIPIDPRAQYRAP